MKRKLVKQGAATLMVSIPSKWAKEQGLDKGDEISIEDDGQNLIIKLEDDSKKEQKASIDVSEYSPLVNVALIHLYIKGVDELEIKFSNPEVIKKFQKSTINQLLGFEIIQQSNNRMVVKDITGIATQDIDELIKRIFFILHSMVEEFLEAIDKKQSLEPIIEIDQSINKFVNFTLRILNKKGYMESFKTPQIYGIVSLLEQIGDIYKELAKECEETKLDKNQIEVLKETRQQLSIFKELLFKFEQSKVVQFAKNYENIKEKIKGKSIADFHLLKLNDTIIRMNNYLLVISL